jgi:Amiloride-sensitive sodium channel
LLSAVYDVVPEMTVIIAKYPLPEKKSITGTAWQLFAEYLEMTTIHGLCFVGEAKRPWLERLIWLIILTMSACMCSFLIHDTWQKWNEKPVIVSYASKFSTLEKVLT